MNLIQGKCKSDTTARTAMQSMFMLVQRVVMGRYPGKKNVDETFSGSSLCNSWQDARVNKDDRNIVLLILEYRWYEH